MEYHPTVGKIRKILDEAGIWYEFFEHDPVTTSFEAAKVRNGYSISQGAKTLIIKTKKNNQTEEFIMLVVPGDQKFNSNKVKKIINSKEIRFANPSEIDQITQGVQIGGVPPFGNLFKLEVYADIHLFSNEKIIFNAGDRRFSIAIKSEDYKTLVRPKIVEII